MAAFVAAEHHKVSTASAPARCTCGTTTRSRAPRFQEQREIRRTNCTVAVEVRTAAAGGAVRPPRQQQERKIRCANLAIAVEIGRGEGQQNNRPIAFGVNPTNLLTAPQ